MHLYYDDDDRDVLIIEADGDVNKDTAQELVGRIEELVEGGLRKIIVDCSKLDYISSYGLGVLLRLHKRMEQHAGDVKICGLKSLIVDALKVTRLSEFFDVYPDLIQAKMAFGPRLP